MYHKYDNTGQYHFTINTSQLLRFLHSWTSRSHSVPYRLSQSSKNWSTCSLLGDPALIPQQTNPTDTIIFGILCLGLCLCVFVCVGMSRHYHSLRLFPSPSSLWEGHCVQTVSSQRVFGRRDSLWEFKREAFCVMRNDHHIRSRCLPKHCLLMFECSRFCNLKQLFSS